LYFQYGNEEIEYLKKRDKLLGEAIDKIGHINRKVDSDLFSSVVHHIIGQQISSAAQATVWNRVLDKLGTINADTVCLCSIEKLQSCGMTFRKAEYIKEFAAKVRSGQFDIKSLYDMPDEDVIRELTSLNGIGVWTAEMIMIFCMQRPDIVSYGDLAIHRGMRMLYHHRKIDKKLFTKYARRYSPYGTVASLYLWAIAGGAIPEMRDYAPKKK
jgi:DNA-3-methyladenine glycosylase II